MANGRGLEEKIFGLGKNHFLNKPFGTGSGSVTSAITGSTPVGKTASKTADHAQKQTDRGSAEMQKTRDMGFTGPTSSTGRRAFAALQHGEKVGEQLTGATTQEVGEGRAQVRDRLQEILAGESAGATALKQQQSQQQKALKSQQAIQGGGQMAEGQRQALKRQADMDYATFVSDEKRTALRDLSREFRGAGGDILKTSGQYGSIMTGSQPAAQASSGGVTVICTELNRQGLLPSELYEKDAEYGRKLQSEDMAAFVGYFVWAQYVAKWMKHSKLLTNIVKIPALSWARHIAGNKNILGAVIETVGLKVCRIIGKIYMGVRYERC